jgi:RNA polymerase sigma-70 factor (ECF subfamily)
VAEQLTEDHFVGRLRESDEEAFRHLFEQYQPIVFRQTLFLVRDPDAAHDVVQETFVRIWDHRASLRVGQSFLAYALRISRNIVRDVARHQAMRERVAGQIPPPALSETDDPAEALQLALLEERLGRVINEKLPERCRIIFLLSRVEGKGYREIAEMLHLSVKTVENQIGHALKILKKHIE